MIGPPPPVPQCFSQLLPVVSVEDTFAALYTAAAGPKHVNDSHLVQSSFTLLSDSVVFLSTGSDDLANVITGVALVKATDEISFYFGCIAQARGMGGAGLFVGSHDDESDRRVYKLDGNDSLVVGVVRAGAMFIADSEMCDIKAVWDKITGNSAVSLHVVVVTPTSVLLLLTTFMKLCLSTL